MTAEPDGPTLTDSAGRGGINAQDGFDYQTWDAIARIPGWLKQQHFDGVLFEGLEDFEARYFAPHAPHGHLLDRFQAKSGTLQKNDLRDVFDRFSAFATSNPGVARVQTLVTPALPPRLEWLGRDPDRVRRARPFYRPFPAVNGASDAKLRGDLVGAFSSPIGDFIADNVDIDLRPIANRGVAQAALVAALFNAFPDLDLTGRQTAAAFETLVRLIGASRGTMLTRADLFGALRDATSGAITDDQTLRLNVRSDGTHPESSAVEIDATAYTGADNTYPPSAQWRADLLDPLSATASWARGHGRSRVQLSGSYRISTAFVLGWAFRAASGFELAIPTRGGPWNTDDRPALSTASPVWDIRSPSRARGRLAIAIGVLRDPTAEVVRALGIEPEDLFVAFLPAPVTDAREAQSSVETVKTAVLAALRTTGAAAIDVFFAGPAALAVALGHRWNALPPTQLYEFMPAERRYVQTALLLDRTEPTKLLPGVGQLSPRIRP